MILNGASFRAGGRFTATFRLNKAVTRFFDAYAVVNLPDGSMLDAIMLTTRITPVATNVRGLPAGFNYPLMALTIPTGLQKGAYSVKVGFFDPNVRVTGPSDAFLLTAAPCTLE